MSKMTLHGIWLSGPTYKAGLAFGSEIAAAQAQEARHWQVAAKVRPANDGTTAVEINAQDAAGRPLAGLEAAGVAARQHGRAFALRDQQPCDVLDDRRLAAAADAQVADADDGARQAMPERGVACVPGAPPCRGSRGAP